MLKKVSKTEFKKILIKLYKNNTQIYIQPSYVENTLVGPMKISHVDNDSNIGVYHKDYYNIFLLQDIKQIVIRPTMVVKIPWK